MTKIELTQGQFAEVDDELLDIVAQYKWNARYTRGTKSYYATRTKTIAPNKETMVYMHRFVWELYNETIPKGMVIDHINHNTLDNRIENLRLVSKRQNSQSQLRNIEGKTTSRYPGIYLHRSRNKWMARATSQGKTHFIGYFPTEELAYQAYCNKLAEWGETPLKGIA